MSLKTRGEDGFPVGSDSHMRNSYGPIPSSELFQHHRNYSYEKPNIVHGWQWSVTFNRWSALVTFSDGWKGFTYPQS